MEPDYSTHLHSDGLHVVADEVAQLFVAAIAAILLAVAHLRVVDARRVAAPPVQLRVAVGASALGFRERIIQNNCFEVHTSYVTDTVDCSRHAWVRIMHSLS